MVDIIVWIIIGLIAALAVAGIAYVVAKIAKLTPEQREEMVVNVLISLVTLAEEKFIGSSKGKEKADWVQAQFNKTAPWFVKLVLKTTKTSSFGELIVKALTKAKSIEWDKFKK